MEQENFSPQESLQLIQSMIAKTRRDMSDNSIYFLLWGWITFAACTGQFVLKNILHYEKHYLVWFSMWLVLIYQVIYLKRKRKQQRVRTYTDDIVGFVWVAFFILMVLFGFLFGKILDPEKEYAFIDPAFLALYGMPTFLSGVILKFRPLIIGGICCWLLSIAATFIVPQYHLLLLPAAMIVAWIIPGYMLRKKFKQQTP